MIPIEVPPWFSRKQTEDVGGTDIQDWYEYKERDPNYCDKGGHRQRSEANQSQHRDHFKKEHNQYRE